MSDCLFCRFVSGEIPVQEVARTDEALAFADVNPKAPNHVLVVPVRHAANLSEFAEQATPEEVGGLFALAARLGRDASPDGYRLVVNEGRDAGQSVFHLHVHVLGGRAFGWPPG